MQKLTPTATTGTPCHDNIYYTSLQRLSQIGESKPENQHVRRAASPFSTLHKNEFKRVIHIKSFLHVKIVSLHCQTPSHSSDVTRRECNHRKPPTTAQNLPLAHAAHHTVIAPDETAPSRRQPRVSHFRHAVKRSVKIPSPCGKH